MKNLSITGRVLIVVSALAMLSAYFFPIWQIKLWAPQYPEGLSMQIWIDHLTGDLASINKMNFYIGMAPIEEEMFPEFKYLKYIIGAIIAIGLFVGLWGKKAGAHLFLIILILLGIGALIDMYIWGYQYGHNLDPTAAIKVSDMTYQPPLIGYKQLLNFLAYSGPHVAGWVMGAVTLTVFMVVVGESKWAGKWKKKFFSRN